MGHKEHSVDIEIKQGEQSRHYRGDWVFVCIMDEYGGRWIQQPTKWGNGVALFSAGVEALRAVAEDDGDERFKVAARAALDAISKFNPGGEVDGTERECCTDGGAGGETECGGDCCGDAECTCGHGDGDDEDVRDAGADTATAGGTDGVRIGTGDGAESGGSDATDSAPAPKRKGRSSKKRSKKGS